MTRLLVGAVFGAMTLFGSPAYAANEGSDDEAEVATVTSPTPDPAYGVWDKLAACESTSNWHIATGNGYSGGLQFDHRTWVAYGGGAYASAAYLASRAEQIAIAERLRSVRGYQPWAGLQSSPGFEVTFPASPRVTCGEWLAFGALLVSYVLLVVLVIGSVVLAIRALNT